MKKIFVSLFVVFLCSGCLHGTRANAFANKNGDSSDFSYKASESSKDFAGEYSKEISDIENYLSNLKNFTASFVQVSDAGDVAEGMFYLSRPNNLRIDYNPPVQLQIIANEKKLYYYDKELDEVTKVGTKRTPVLFLLRDELSFDGKRVEVVNFEKGRRTMEISLRDKKKEELGIMTMIFDSKPLILRKIRIANELNQITDINFYDIDTNKTIDKNIFKFIK